MNYLKKLVGVFAFAIVSLGLPNMVFAEEYSEVYKRITTDGTLTVNSVIPKNAMEMELFTTNTVKNLVNDPSYMVYSEPYSECDSESGKCDMVPENEDGSYTFPIVIQWETEELDENGNQVFVTEEHDIKVTFNGTVSNDMQALTGEMIGKLNNKEFVVTDLGYINFIYTIPKGGDIVRYIDKALLYSNDMLKTIGNSNISYAVDNRMGSVDPWNVSAAGFMTLSYNNVMTDLVNQIGVYFKPVIYVPSDTEDTNEAYIAAAMKRINEYFGKDIGLKITTNKKISEMINSAGLDESSYIDGDIFEEAYNGMNNKLDMTYKVEVNGNTYYMLIEKDSSKMETPLFGVKDATTNISISASNGEVALDTSLKAKYLEENSEEYKLIESKINGDFTAIDFTLYSNIKGSNITKLENGKFEVSVPLPEKLNNKTLSAYYITTDGTLEEHEITVKDGYATFETNHFSVYTLAEKVTTNKVEESTASKELNPKTGDNIVMNVVLLITGALGIAGISFVYFKKKNL